MRTPSTKTLQAFQLAARTMSFKIAARELCLTPSAVSHRVKALEREVGAPLFIRGARQLMLTDAGSAYLAEIEAVFRRLEAATRDLRARQSRRPLRLRVPPYFASEFLLPRLPALHAAQPDLELQIDADGSRALRFDDADISIVLGSGPWEHMQASRLFAQTYVLACAPSLIARQPIRTAADLENQVLLVHRGRRDAWERWAEAGGIDAPRPRKSISFDTMTEVVHAAERGAGVGLIPLPLTAERLRGRSLVRLLEQSLRTEESYFLLHRRDSGARLVEVRDWIIAETRRILVEPHGHRKSVRVGSRAEDDRSARREADAVETICEQSLMEQAETVPGACGSVAGA